MTLLDPVADLEGSTPPSDAELIFAVRAGNRHADGALYDRRLAVARGHASQLAARTSTDADDLVAEAFAKVFTALRSGHGPDRAFGSYLLTTMRALYSRMRGDRRLELSDDMAQHDQGIPWSDPVEAELNSSLAARAFSTLPEPLAARAFSTLPERWQTVLTATASEEAPKAPQASD